MEVKEIIRLKDISKSFPGVKALDRVNLTVNEGEVHALLGENGAGKSTLMNIICGNLQPEEGEIIWQGEQTVFNRPHDAQRAGIGIVHQENSLLPYLDIKSNIYMGHYPSKAGFICRGEVENNTIELLENLGIKKLNPHVLVERLSLPDKQMVEVAKALSIGPRLLLLDEPTAALTLKETDILFNIIRKLKDEGVGIIYISHRLEEVFKIADRITILRDGVHVLTKNTDEMTIDSVITSMVGRNLTQQKKMILSEHQQSQEQKETILEVKNLTSRGKFEDVSFALKKGEVLGIAGLVGAGRSELLEAIFGYESFDRGEILIKGNKVKIHHPKDAIRNNMVLIPEERKVKGLFLEASVKDNINIATIRKNIKKIFLDKKRQIKVAGDYVKKLNIKTPSISKKIGELSGGNQQKAIIARWLLAEPDILLLDEPTHGIDVGAKGEIYKIIDDLKKKGIGIILVSSEMPELILMSDRIIVMSNGKITGELGKSKDITEENIMILASGRSL